MAKDEKGAKNKGAAETSGKKKKPILLFIIIGLVLLVAAGGGAFFFLYSAPSDEEIANQIAKDEKAQHAPQPQESGQAIGVTLELTPFVVNLADPKARHFLKASLVLELSNEDAKEVAQKLMPRIRNDILMLLSSQTIEDVISIEGKVRLRDEIIARVSRIVGSNRLRNVYFSQFVVQ